MYIKIDKKKNRIKDILNYLELKKFKYIIKEDKNTIKIGVIGDKKNFNNNEILKFEGVMSIETLSVPFKFISREFFDGDFIIEIKGKKIGAGNFMVMAGPCSVEDRASIFEIAKEVKRNGGEVLRGGAFKPRTSPYDFQGLGEDGLKYLREAGDEYGLLVVTEVMDTMDIELIDKYTDIFQVGARNMQNFSLLKALGKVKKPILLKRGLSATIKEFLMAAEYIVANGNENIILCERGIRTFETATRNTVDINSIPYIKEKSYLSIIIDASHGTGIRSLVQPVTLAGIIAGADGALIEVHNNPPCAISDGEQSLYFEQFEKLMVNIEKILNLKKELL